MRAADTATRHEMEGGMTTYGQTSFTCPRCRMTSHHPDDVQHGYCANCHAFTGEPAELVVAGNRSVAGYCPMGCGNTLFAGSGGHITCARLDCPEPGAVDQILSERETEHVVVFGERDFAIVHPLRERLGEYAGANLVECALHDHCANLSGPPVKLGRYRAWLHEGTWSWEAL